ncbi:hypothetical protein [Longimicrobium sp.]|uniref:hypothetical protein n=1 Tax=Longimicrobium sp. TaxID=2029185 RepID=UPI002C35F932|nr:hypothetical protein [Longimicrobium sp.]HSU14964.1 hypothetical protein [Longimicrobium sp.]
MKIPALRPIPEDRPLTYAERALATWMLEHGEADGRAFLPQLGRARVVSRCGCGCASIALAVDGLHRPAAGGLRILGDFVHGDGDEVSGIFIFEREGVLAGIEVHALGGGTPASLPAPEVLRPLR